MLKRFFFALIKYSALIFSLMVVGALSTFITLRLFTSGDEVAVPDLSGKDPVEAIQLLRRQGLQLKILPQKRYSTRVPAERIAAQRPNAGTKIKQGRSIEVYMSLGPERAIVPELVGQTTRVATITLQQRGLHQGKIIYVTSPGEENDVVMAQYPAPGTTLVGARAVNLLVTKGYNPRTIYVMPDVIGKNIDQVDSYFRDAGLRVGASQPVDYPGLSPGTVVKQSPPAGYKVSPETFIGLYYSQ